MELTFFCSASNIRGYPSSKYVVYATACVYRELYGKGGGITVSINFTKRCHNGFKFDTRDKFATHLRKVNFISNEIVIYIYTSCRIHEVF